MTGKINTSSCIFFLNLDLVYQTIYLQREPENVKLYHFCQAYLFLALSRTIPADPSQKTHTDLCQESNQYSTVGRLKHGSHLLSSVNNHFVIHFIHFKIFFSFLPNLISVVWTNNNNYHFYLQSPYQSNSIQYPRISSKRSFGASGISYYMLVVCQSLS